jgi:hypothetical protein
MSHTVTVKIQFKDPDALARAVTALNGRYLGQGTHALFSSQETGLGFHLPGWTYPCVSLEDGECRFDDYHGKWGNRADLDQLRAVYAAEVAKNVCHQQGWMYEQQPDGALLIYHPDGGTLTVAAGGSIDACNFTGPSCAAATAPIEEALGVRTDQARKIEYNQTQQTVGETND